MKAKSRINQSGISSLVLLFAVVLGIFLLWEISSYITNYTSPPSGSSTPPGPPQVICTTGEAGNCNDSNDQFLFTE